MSPQISGDKAPLGGDTRSWRRWDEFGLIGNGGNLETRGNRGTDLFCRYVLFSHAFLHLNSN